MVFHLNEEYVKILRLLQDNLPRTSEQICEECHMTNRLKCTGKLSMLRRLRAVEPTDRTHYRISLRGKEMLASKGYKITVSPRQTKANQGVTRNDYIDPLFG